MLLGDLTSVLHSTITLLPTCVQAVYKANGSETTLSLSGYCSQGYFFKELKRSQTNYGDHIPQIPVYLQNSRSD